MKIIAFCNLQFICHFATWKIFNSSQLVLSVIFPTEGSGDPLEDMTTNLCIFALHPRGGEKLRQWNSRIRQAGIIIAASIVNISRRSFTWANKHCRQKLCPVESPHFQNSKHRLCKQSDGGLNTVLATSCNGEIFWNKQTERLSTLSVPMSQLTVLMSQYFQDSAVKIKTKWKMLWKEKM